MVGERGQDARSRAGETPALRTAADEVDDFEAVAFVQLSFRPAIARDDVAVEFDSDAIGFHAELLDEVCDRERGANVEGFWLAVDVDVHAELWRP